MFVAYSILQPPQNPEIVQPQLGPDRLIRASLVGPFPVHVLPPPFPPDPPPELPPFPPDPPLDPPPFPPEPPVEPPPFPPDPPPAEPLSLSSLPSTQSAIPS